MRNLYIITWICVAVGIDYLTKVYALTLPYNEQISMVSFVDFTLNFNKGAAFGMLSYAKMRYLFVILACCISFYLLMLLIKQKIEHRLENIIYVLIIAGAQGNAIDRMLYGHVVDFIDINFQGMHWYIFNIADVYLSCAFILYCFLLIKYKGKISI